MYPSPMSALRALSPGVRGSLYIVIGSVFAGILGPLAGTLYDQGMTPFSFVVWRGIVAGAALWLLVLWRRRRDRRSRVLDLGRLPRRQRLALLGFIASNIVLNTALFIAFDRIPIAIALLTFYMYPVLLALFGRISGSEALGPIKVVALAIAVTGMVLVVTANPEGGSTTGLDPLGLGLGFLSAFVAAAWIYFGRECRDVPAEQAMGVALTVTVLAVGLIAVLAGPASVLAFPFEHPGTWPTILVSGVLSGAGAAVLFTLGVRLISRTRAGILGLIEPIVGTVAAAALLSQVLAPLQLLGGALVLCAAVLIQRDVEQAGGAPELVPVAQ